MNRRSFIGGILAACVAPAAFLPRAQDRYGWRVRRGNGLFIAEFQYASNPAYESAEYEIVFFHRRESLESAGAQGLEIEPKAILPAGWKEVTDLVKTGPDRLGRWKWEFVSDSMVEIK